MALPDYSGGSIVNLMSSILQATGDSSDYPALHGLDPGLLRERRNVVLLVLDGLGHDYLVGRSGSVLHQHLALQLTSVFPSTTATAVTTYLTGDAPRQHAVTGWFMFFKELGAVMAVLRGSPRFGGSGLRNSGVDTKRLFNHVPVFERMGIPSYVVSSREIADSDFNASHQGSACVRTYDSLAQMFREVEKLIAAGPSPKFIYCYWPGLDHTGHLYGIESDQARRHFGEIDAAFARFLDNAAGSDTAILVTADHGMIDVSPEHYIELADHPLLEKTLALPLCGEPRVAYCYVRPRFREAFEKYVENELGEYLASWPSEELVEKGYFGPGESHPRLLERIGDYTLIMKDRFVIKDWLPDETRYVQVGVHGGVSDAEMHVPLIVATV